MNSWPGTVNLVASTGWHQREVRGFLVGLGVQVKLHAVHRHMGSWGKSGRRAVASDPHHGHLEQPGVLTGAVNAAHGNMKACEHEYIQSTAVVVLSNYYLIGKLNFR